VQVSHSSEPGQLDRPTAYTSMGVYLTARLKYAHIAHRTYAAIRLYTHVAPTISLTLLQLFIAMACRPLLESPCMFSLATCIPYITDCASQHCVNGDWLCQFSTPLHRIHTPLPITKEMLLVVTSATPTADDDAYWPPTLARPLKFEFQNSKMANGQRFENH